MVQQHVMEGLQQPALSWEDPQQAWTGNAPLDTTQLDHLWQDEVFQLDPTLLDVQMALQDPTMSTDFLEYLYFGQGLDQPVDLTAEMWMEF